MDIFMCRFYIAWGDASASMSRGSFRHRDRIRRWRKLAVSDVQRCGTDCSFILTDPLTGISAPSTWEQIDTASPVVLHRLRLSPETFGSNRIRLELPSGENEHFYGGGETFAELDLKGHLVRIWSAEHQNTRIIANKIILEKILGVHPERGLRFERYESYYAQPTFQSDQGYFIHIDGSGYVEMDFRRASSVSLLLRGSADLYLGEAAGFPALSEGLSSLIGKQPPLPDRLQDGMILATQRGVADVDHVIELAGAYSIPLIGVWCQDWCGCRKTKFGYQVMWNWQWDRNLYPDLPEHIREWKRKGVGFYGYINPFMATEGPLYAEASEKGYCVHDRSGADYMVTITTFPAAMIDLTNPDACAWYRRIIRDEMIGIGMDGWMADFGEYLPTDAVLFSGEDAFEVHNRWPAMWARLNQQTVSESPRAEELFFFVRAGHTGTVSAAPMVWNGDQHADWSEDQGIGSVIPAALSLSMSGIGLSHSDIGGYTSISHIKRDRELLLRWTELCCFSPLMRSHEGNRPDANIQFDHDEDLLLHMARMGQLHVLLKPLLSEVIREYREHGTPAMRPLFYHYPDRYLAGIKDEYLLGRDLLVCPVLKPGQATRRCILPDDRWIHLFTGQEYSGGTADVECPPGCPPVFLRKSSPFAQSLPERVRDLTARKTPYQQ